mmetsp:Transcript_29056/g.34117  ORF Transcript_29056/g.34117 Transcript_29056/m.34117 type:complete len:103 (-) Transcript_29056:214-522(-)
MIRQFCNNVCKVLEMPTISLEADQQTSSKGNCEAKLQDYLNRVLKQAQKGVNQLKKNAESVSFTNVLNQSTDAFSNAAGMHKSGIANMSTSFVDCVGVDLLS